MQQLQNLYNPTNYSSCRTCLESLDDIENYYDIFEIPDLQTKFTLCTSLLVEPGDGFPTALCETCSSKIEEFYIFQQMCISSKERFLEYVNSEKKPSPTELAIYEQNLLVLTEAIKENEDKEEDENEDKDPISLDQYASFVKKELLIDANDQIEFSSKEEVEESDESQPYVEYNQIVPGTSSNQSNELKENDSIGHTKSSVRQRNRNNLFPKPKLECEICQKCFKKTETLERHMCIHKGIKPFSCHLCDKTYVRRHRLKLHIEDIHERVPKEKFPCTEPDCERIMPTQQALRRHMIDIHCHIECVQNVTANSSDDGSDTMNSVQDKNPKNNLLTNKKLECEICKKCIKTTEALERHMRVHKGLQPFACHLCDKSYARRSRLKLHIRSIHEGVPQEKFPCTEPECGRLLASKQILRKHIKDIHRQDKRKPLQGFVCEQCGKVLTSSTTLKNHRFLHSGQQLPHECPQCHKRYIKKCKLKEHMMRHAGIRNYVCPICGAKKTTAIELKKHINFHTKEKKYPCKFCDVIFYNEWNYSRHKRIVHEGIKNYPCSYCDLSFGKAETRKNHEMTHTGEKPHECNICQKKFIQRTALKKHKAVHLKKLKGHSNEK